MNRIQNNNNNNNKIKIKDKKEKKNKRKVERASDRERQASGERIYFNFSSYRFFLRSTKIGPQVFVGAEGKVDLLDESYAWTPKSWSFIKLHEVENFLTYVISSLKAML